MSQRRAQSEPILAVMLAGLLVLSVPAVVVPEVGLGSGVVGETPPSLATPTVTPPALNETDTNTTATTDGETPLGKSSTSAESENTTHTATGRLVTQRTTMHGVRGLVNITAPTSNGQSDNLTRAVRLAKSGMRLQVAQLNRSHPPTDPTDIQLPATPTPDHDSPSAAAFAILNRYNVTPTADEAADIHALDDLPEPTRSELTDVLDAYHGYYLATQKAYADANRTRLRALANVSDTNVQAVRTGSLEMSGTGMSSVASPATLEAAGVNTTQVRAAQVRLLQATVDLKTALNHPDALGLAGPASHDTVDVGMRESPILAINLSRHGNTYEDDYALLIDRGGNDTYNNNAGGGRLGAAALIDLAGNDNYTSGGRLGVNGGGNFGAGFLLDAGGDDNYTAGRSGTNGGGAGGVGFLLDAEGNDVYTAGGFGTNGGGRFGGTGFLLDAGGDDIYTAGDESTNGGGTQGGTGSLIDVAGDDTYTAGSGGVNGGAREAVGMLVDTGGDDTYKDDTGPKRPDDFQVNKKGTVGVQVDIQATDKIPDTEPPSMSSTTPTYSADLCVEGLRDSCDRDGTVGQDEDIDNDSVYGTIQAAVNAAADNQTVETIEVRPDTYHENVTVDTPGLTLVANHSAGLGDVTLDGRAGKGDPREDLVNGVKVQAAAVKLTGFIIQNYTSDEIAIAAEANQSLVRGNTVHGSIAVTEANGTAIRANQIDQNNSGAAGLTVATAPYATVANNGVTGGGITLTNSPTATVTNNTVRDISAEDNGGPVDAPGTAGTQATPAADSPHSVADAEPVGITVTGGRDVTVADNTVRSLSEYSAQDGPVGIAVVATTAPTVTNNVVRDLTESGGGAGPVGIVVADGSATTVTHNSVDTLRESGSGAGPVGIRLAASTLAVPITDNEVTNTQAAGDGGGPVGLEIASSTLDSPIQSFGPNAFADGGGVLITNSTVSPITDTTFTGTLSVVNSTVAPVTNNKFTGNVTILNSTATPIKHNQFTARFLIHDSTELTVAKNTFNGADLSLQSTTGMTVAHNTFSGRTGAIKLHGITRSTVVHNTVVALNETAHGRPVGVKVSNGTDITVAHNELVNLSDGDTTFGEHDGPVGIQVTSGTNITVAYNVLVNLSESAGGTGPVGISVAKSNATTVTDNELANFSEGRAGSGPVGITITNGTDTTLADNSLSNLRELHSGTGPVGITVTHGSDTTVTNNALSNLVEKDPKNWNNGNSGELAGLMVADSTDNTVTHNRVSGLKSENYNERANHINYSRAEGVGISLRATADSRVQWNNLTTVNTSVRVSSTTPSDLVLTRNQLDGNGTYGVRNTGGGIINATHNYWGAGTGPASPDPDRPLADPQSGVLADGAGAAVSEGPQEQVANVRFDPFLGLAASAGDLVVEGTCAATGDADANSGAAENNDGDDTYGTIQAAVNASAPGQMIVVIPCTYTETVNVTTPDLVLRAPSGDVVLDGETERAHGILINASNVTIRGVTVRRYTTAGIAVAADGATMRGNTFTQNDNGTVIHDGGASSEVQANQFVNNSFAGLVLTATASVAATEVDRNRFGGYRTIECQPKPYGDCYVRPRANGAFGIYNANQSGVVNATYNHWLGDGPSSPSPEANLTDPATGAPANGTGDAVSAGANGEANVRFAPFESLTFSADHVVDDNTWECPDAGYTNIQPAMNNANEGETVGVCPGTYSDITFRNGITVRAPSPATTAIQGTVSFSGEVTGFTVRGFTVRGSGHGFALGTTAPTGRIIENDITNNNRNGLNWRDKPSPTLKVVNNNFTNNEHGIECGTKHCAAGKMEVTNNFINNNRYYGIFDHDDTFPGTNNIWSCGGPSGGWPDPETGRMANGSGDRIYKNVRWDPYKQLASTCGLPDVSPPVENESNNSAPTVKQLSVAEVETNDPAAEFNAEWRVTDSDGNLNQVQLELYDETAGHHEQTEWRDVSGESAHGTTRLQAAGDDGSGHKYTVELTVYDEEGATGSDSASITETEPTPTERAWPATATPTPTPTPASGGGGEGDGPGGSGNGTGQGGTSTSTSGPSGGGEGSSTESTAQDESSNDDSETTEATSTPPDSPTETTTVTPPPISPTPEFIPGFGVSAWVTGFILLVGLIAVRRRD